MPDAPKFSFLATAYRTEDVISRLIDSVRAQTDPDWELVVVDNGRSDEMARVVGGYAERDPRVRLVRQENRGAAGGINAASAAARGRYLSVVHSDDLVEPEFCARLGAVLDERPDVDAVCCDAWFYSAATGERLQRSYLEDWGEPRPDPEHAVTVAELIEGLCPYYTGAVRREVWQRYGTFDQSTIKVGDLEIFLRIVAAGHTLVVLPDKLAGYVYAAESTSRGAQSVLEVERAREALVTRFAHASGTPEDLAALRRETARSRHRREVAAAKIALLDGDAAAARAHAAQALRHKRDARTLLIRIGLTLAPARTRAAYLRR